MSETASAIYCGSVMHHRVRPREHRLKYSMFSLLLDLDEIDEVAARLKLFSRNAFNVFGFRDGDYGDGSAAPLRTQVERHLRAAGIDGEGGPIRLLTMPRILGYAFNPLSVYFCYRPSGPLAAILYEVNNTFGQRHGYLLPVEESAGASVVQTCPKNFYVSPFMDMAMSYRFAVVPPGERLSVSIVGADAQGPMITAVLEGQRHDLNDGALARVFFAYPLLTLKVIAGIHWEALLIWLKGIKLRTRPPAPATPITTGLNNQDNHAS